MRPPRTRPAESLPPLKDGDRMTQPEFHRRYEAYPDHVKIELIGGTVYVASPMRRQHGTYVPELSFVLTFYKANTPGTEVADNMTAVLGKTSEPQPDLMLILLNEFGGQSRYDEDNYLVGPPEFVAEVAHSTRAIDMNQKRKDYLAAGVQEYLVLCVEEQEIHWFHFPSKRKLKAKDGLWKSNAFPGLWLDGPALLARDTSRLLATIQQGIASPEHAAFVGALDARRASHRP